MINKIFLDVDGILANWNQAVREHFDVDCEDPTDFNGMHKLVGISKTVFWDDLLGDYKFWRNIPVYPEAQDVVELLREYVLIDQICLLTSVPSGHSMAGRFDWIKNHFPIFTQRKQYLFGPSKGFCASEDALLIDDADHNIAEFEAAGGLTILYPRPWNDNSNLTNRVTFLKEELLELEQEGEL